MIFWIKIPLWMRFCIEVKAVKNLKRGIDPEIRRFFEKTRFKRFSPIFNTKNRYGWDSRWKTANTQSLWYGTGTPQFLFISGFSSEENWIFGCLEENINPSPAQNDVFKSKISVFFCQKLTFFCQKLEVFWRFFGGFLLHLSVIRRGRRTGVRGDYFNNIIILLKY